MLRKVNFMFSDPKKLRLGGNGASYFTIDETTGVVRTSAKLVSISNSISIKY